MPPRMDIYRRGLCLGHWREKMREKYCFTSVNGTRQLNARGGRRRSTRLMRRSGYTYTEDSDLPSPREEEINEYLKSEREATGDHDYYNEGEEGEIDYPEDEI
ncbi:unnamed protein product [Fusarium fujikuroi]|nr:unnamed protein product [Fusarium fujikuroi]